MILLAKCENREELNRDALIHTIADAYLEQPGEAATRLYRPSCSAYNAQTPFNQNERTIWPARFISISACFNLLP